MTVNKIGETPVATRPDISPKKSDAGSPESKTRLSIGLGEASALSSLASRAVGMVASLK